MCHSKVWSCDAALCTGRSQRNDARATGVTLGRNAGVALERGTGAIPRRDVIVIVVGPGNDTGAGPEIGTGAGPKIGTGAGPKIGTGAGPKIGTGAGPKIDTGADPGIDTGAGPGIGRGLGQGRVIVRGVALVRTVRAEGVDPERRENLMRMVAGEVILARTRREREVAREIMQRRRDHETREAGLVTAGRGVDPVREGTREADQEREGKNHKRRSWMNQ